RRAGSRSGRARAGFHGVERGLHRRFSGRSGSRSSLVTGADGARAYNQTEAPMIYCVIPRELEDELYDKMVEYYRDNPDVTVIVDRREGDDRRKGRVFGGKREIRDRRRTRATGTFPETDPPE